MLDPALGDLKQRIREAYKQRGIEEPFLFENLDSLTKVLADQRMRVQELKEADPPVHRLPMLCCIIDDIGLESTRFRVFWIMRLQPPAIMVRTSCVVLSFTKV